MNQYLSQMGLGPIEAMNIPLELEHEPFLGRRVFRDVSKAELPKLRAEFGPLLLKPSRHPKRFEAMPYEERLLGEIPDDELLLSLLHISGPPHQPGAPGQGCDAPGY